MGKTSPASVKAAFQSSGQGRETDPRKSYNHPCTIARALDILGDRWTLLILRDLMSGLHRYTEIQESCQGMSPNVLSDRLKRLQEDGLIERHHRKGLPPQVEYTLTEKGWAVRPVLQSLIDWAKQHVGSLDPEDRETGASTDFVVRVIPTFAFHAANAAGVAATMVVEIAEAPGCTAWTFEIRDGHLLPRRNASPLADIHLRTTTSGFFAFVRGQANAEEVGELNGDPDVARAIQACFITH